MARFEKGHHIGRPKGSKDKSYLTLQFWFNEMMKDWDKIRPAQRVKTSAQLMQMLTNKLKAIPGSQEQSVINAKEAHELLQELTQVSKVEGEKKDCSESLSSPNPTPPL